MPTLWLVQPVFGRVGLARLCMEQRARMVDELRGRGVDAHVVVIGDDDNLDTAREFDFHVLERPNELGRKVNDGIEYACREGGANYVSYIGSDDWCLASWFVRMPPRDTIKTSKWAAFVDPLGERLIVREVAGSVGNAPWIMPRKALAEVDFRPVIDRRMNGIDGSIRNSLTALPPRPPKRVGYRTALERRECERERFRRCFHHEDGDPLRLVDFKGSKEQITSWSLVSGRRRWVRHDEQDVWGALATRYPADLVERMERFYAEGMPQ